MSQDTTTSSSEGGYRLAHIAIAVTSQEKGEQIWQTFAQGVHRERVEKEGVEVSIFSLGDVKIELLMPLGHHTPVGRFLARRGEGLHHIALEVTNLDSQLQRLQQNGILPLEGYPREGAEGKRVAFLNPKTTGGVLVELIENNRSIHP